jgi:signal transduction histidine kinase
MLDGIKILAVDDEEMSLEMLAATLGNRGGGPCLKATNGREAMYLLESNPAIDIVLLDLQMPIMDGFEVLIQCKGNPYLSDIPIIVLTANHHEKLKSLQLGADDFMSKPYDLEELELRITKLVQSRRLAQAAKQAKHEFLSIVSHELRTPMHQIIGLSGLLDAENLGNEQREFIGLLKEATANLTTTITDILNYVNLDQGSLSTAVEPFSLRDMVKIAIESQIDRATNNGITFECSIADDVADALVGSSLYVSRVFGILIENAVKFSSDGAIRIIIREEQLGRFGSRFICTISDQGGGIPAEFHEKIFEPFVQVDSSNSREFNGIGLGLAIAKRLAEQMGGTITVQNNEGKGSSFNLTFYCHLV